MKRRALIRRIEACGCVLIRHGSRHDWYRNSDTGISQPVPRHAEINEHVARHILSRLCGRSGSGGAGT